MREWRKASIIAGIKTVKPAKRFEFRPAGANRASVGEVGTRGVESLRIQGGGVSGGQPS